MLRSTRMLESPIWSTDEDSRMGCFKIAAVVLRALLVPKVQLAYENLALRQQLAIFEQSGTRMSVLGRAVATLGRLAFSVGHRSNGYGRPLAPPRFSSELVVEMEGP